jgi:Mg2+-importing ATPase
LKKAGQVVGYIGDGINDAPALHAADVGLSVDSAVDVAREAADFVLLEHDLEVLVDGVREGRRTFANTLKYVFIATSANFGNMFSMAGASLFLPFLPLLPKQILLINLLTDLPEMTIASDNVDTELEQVPRRWDIKFIQFLRSSTGSTGAGGCAESPLVFGSQRRQRHLRPDQWPTR